MDKAYRNFLVKLFTIGIYIVYYELNYIIYYIIKTAAPTQSLSSDVLFRIF